MKSSYLKSLALLFTLGFLMSSCTVVRQGEVGVKRTFGKYSDKIFTSGLKGFNPFTSTIVKVPAQTINLEVRLDIPSKEGLTIGSEVSILYNIEPKKVPDLLRNLGIDYEASVVLPVFRSAVADISSKYFAKDMHSGNRGEIEKAIKDLMMKTMEGKGIFVENVLLKSIQLPRTLSKAIEEKLESEQQAQRMEFVLQGAKKEAERRIIEAEGVRDANKIISQGLTDKILQFKNIEAWLKLSESANSKVIITNGNMQMMMNPAESTDTQGSTKKSASNPSQISLLKE